MLISITSKYDIIYADPPWPYYGDPNKMGAAGKEYELMTLEEICSVPVKNIANDPSVVVLWTTSSHLLDAAKVLDSWGYTYRGILYVWVKTAKDGRILKGIGVRPSFTKPTSELCLIGSTEKKGRTFPILTEAQEQVILHPRLKHSEKPNVFREKIVELFGDRPRIELFARERFDGWDCWGNQIGEC